jgi:hypothetical protein
MKPMKPKKRSQHLKLVRNAKDPALTEAEHFFRAEVARKSPFQRPAPSPKRKNWQREFVRVPWEWVERLRDVQRLSTYRLALLLLYEHWRQGGRPIVLSNILAADVGLSPRSKWNAVLELEGLGLIRADRRSGRSPKVVVKAVKPS